MPSGEKGLDSRKLKDVRTRREIPLDENGYELSGDKSIQDRRLTHRRLMETCDMTSREARTFLEELDKWRKAWDAKPVEP